MRIFKFLIMSLLIITAKTAFSAPLAADDFLPPAQAQDEQAMQKAQTVQQPEAVQQETGIGGQPALAAATPQDAINAAINNLPAVGGCEQIKFPSGFGWVATGTSVYEYLPNPTASLIAQRNAYQKAYLQAKKNLAAALYGLSTQGKEQLAEMIATANTANVSLANTQATFSESITEAVNGLLRGYVVYSVKDVQDNSNGVVTVAIVTTPKTQGRAARIDVNALEADSIAAGLQQVLTELQTSLLSPVGGKVITVPATGELAFIGFGSAVIPPNQNAATQAKLTINAQKNSALRARSALCGIIIGDNLSSLSSLDSQTMEMAKEFEQVNADDPVQQNSAAIQKLDQRLAQFQNQEMSKEQITSVKSGVLPPGVTTKTFLNRDKTMATSVAVYLPGLSAAAAKAGQEMKNSKILENQPGIQYNGPGAAPAPGPSGQISNDADL